MHTDFRPAPLAIAIALAVALPATAGAATFTVTNTNATGAGSLAQAVADARSNTTITRVGDGRVADYDVIEFATSLNGATITVDSQLFIEDDSVHVNGFSAGNRGVVLKTSNRNQPIAYITREGSYSDAKFTGVIFDGDDVEGPAGAIWYNGSSSATNGRIELHNVEVRDFDINAESSAVYIGGATDATITNSIFAGNHSDSGNGAAININVGDTVESNFDIINSTIADNSTGVSGGGLAFYGNFSQLTLDQVSVALNSAAGRAGGLLVEAGDVVLLNSTVSGNEALGTSESELSTGYGGGIFVNTDSGAGIELNHVTVTNNVAQVGGGVAFNEGTALAGTHTILAGNSDTVSGTDTDNYSGVTLALTNSLTAGDPQLAPLTTSLPLYHLPRKDSVVVDAGDAESLTTVPNVDQLGRDRVQGKEIDIGAIERSKDDDDSSGALGTGLLGLLVGFGLFRRRR